MGLIDRFKALDTPIQVLLVIGLVIAALIAVVVLVVLLVIVASVLGAFTLGLGEEPEQTAPVASFEIQGTPDGAQITHNGGDAIDARNLYVRVDGQREPWTAHSRDSSVSAGDSIVVDARPGQTVRVIYDDGEARATLARSTVD